MNKLNLLFIFLLSSCAVLLPNPNRHEESLVEKKAPAKLVEFFTDYCTQWPNGKKISDVDWSLCCFKHDLQYWIGGTEIKREQSDAELKSCVEKSGSPLNGTIMYLGVRVAGGPGNAEYSWGYGWTHNRKYEKIESDELKNVPELLRSSLYYQTPSEKKIIEKFIQELSLKTP
jgi:hypothetical protein